MPLCAALDVCELEMDPGNCHEILRRFYYDLRHRVCRTFTYTGCGGNGNRFRSRRQCERHCLGTKMRSNHKLSAYVDPLESIGNCSATSNNMKLVHWPLTGGSINGQCTDHRIAV